MDSVVNSGLVNTGHMNGLRVSLTPSLSEVAFLRLLMSFRFFERESLIEKCVMQVYKAHLTAELDSESR